MLFLIMIDAHLVFIIHIGSTFNFSPVDVFMIPVHGLLRIEHPFIRHHKSIGGIIGFCCKEIGEQRSCSIVLVYIRNTQDVIDVFEDRSEVLMRM